MIQYKLIKCYPGSPKLGTIHSEDHHLFRGIEYYNDAPEYWQKVDEPKFEAGKWYKENQSFKDTMIVYVVSVNGEDSLKVYGFDGYGKWFDNSDDFGDSGLAEATPQEIENALVCEAKKRGYVNGNYKCLIGTTFDGDMKDFFFDTKDNSLRITVREARNNCVFRDGKWAEIIKEEVDYEILSFKGTISGVIYEIQPNKKYVGIGVSHNYTLEECLSNYNGKFEIFSVKRLSDGSVFTIGDKYYAPSDRDRAEEIITRFEIAEFKDEIKVFCDDSFGYYLLEHIQKLPKKDPLFTTEDGVDVFIGDYFWYVGDEFTINNGKAFDKGIRSYVKHFSTKEKAEEYILLNKPCLSLNDLLFLWKDCITTTGLNDTRFYNKVKALAKSKL